MMLPLPQAVRILKIRNSEKSAMIRTAEYITTVLLPVA